MPKNFFFLNCRHTASLEKWNKHKTPPVPLPLSRPGEAWWPWAPRHAALLLLRRLIHTEVAPSAGFRLGATDKEGAGYCVGMGKVKDPRGGIPSQREITLLGFYPLTAGALKNGS